MKIAISNIAWKLEEDKDVIKLLRKYSIGAIEIAPTMIWKEPTIESPSTFKKYKKFWKDEGLQIESAQALLFNHPELTIFKSNDRRKKTLDYIEKMIQVCSLLGVQDIIFGSPKNRDSGVISHEQSSEIACEFFYKIGEISQKHKIFFCIEPVPEYYGTKFINNSKEGIDLVKKVNHPHFKLHLDSGALMIAKENNEQAIQDAFPYLRHMHISEKDLFPIGTTGVNHQEIARILKKLHYSDWLSIEMRKKEEESNLPMIEKTLQFVSKIYNG